MRAPQRVEQFHRELEIKKAKALRNELRRQQDSAGSIQDLVVESPKEAVVVVPDPVPATTDAVSAPAPEIEVAPEVESLSGQDQPEEVPVETPDVATDPAPSVASSTTSRKRRS